MAWVKRAGGYGSCGYGQGPDWQPAPIPVYEPPAFSQPADVSGVPYGSEPYVRATMPDRGTVDAKACRWSATHVLIHWEVDHGTEVHNAWVPTQWVTRISREESAWRSPYDRTSDYFRR
jgi:hypothetical protein